MTLQENIQRIRQIMQIDKLIKNDLILESLIDKEFSISYKFNPEVESLQKELKLKNYNLGKYGPNKDGIDGKYGKLTKLAHEAAKKETTPEEFNKNKENFEDQPEEISDSSLKSYNFHSIPGGKGNYRSAQITIADYPGIIEKYGIKNIIRMNGDGDDSKHRGTHPETSKKEEEEMCKKLGCTFNFINAHEGYSSGKGYVGSLKKILPILNKGNTLVHCAHGADRTGYVVASHLRDIGAITDKDELWEYTTQYNRWQDKINNGKFFGSGYDKYADAFYPIEDLKKSKWDKK